jgi:sugar (glycoside-pentoside-hexuronide) transporter
MADSSGFAATPVERVSYGLYFVGQLFFYTIVTSFFQLYLTDAGIPAAFVGGIFMLAKVWDAVNDPLFGIIVDRVKLKKGKYIPWVRLSTLLIPLATVFMFIMPSSLSTQAKIVWSFCAYIFWDTGYTICDVPIYALSMSMTHVIRERDTLLVYAKLYGFAGALIVMIAHPLLYPLIGWPASAASFSVLGALLMLPVCVTARERRRVKNDQEPSIKALIGYLAKNKYLLILSGTMIISAITNSGGTVMNYMAIHCLGGPEWLTILALMAALPVVAAVPVLQRLVRRFNKASIFKFSLAATMGLGLVMYAAGYAPSARPLLFTAFVLRSFFSVLIASIATMITADCAEYGHYKSGERADGVAFSIQTFTAKITGALSGAVAMFLLGAAGFAEGEGAAQSEKAVQMIWFMFSAFPAFSGVAALVLLLLFYRLKDSDVAVMARCNSGEIARAEAEALLSRKY